MSSRFVSVTMILLRQRLPKGSKEEIHPPGYHRQLLKEEAHPLAYRQPL
jgi:hypothetical protein